MTIDHLIRLRGSMETKLVRSEPFYFIFSSCIDW